MKKLSIIGTSPGTTKDSPIYVSNDFLAYLKSDGSRVYITNESSNENPSGMYDLIYKLDLHHNLIDSRKLINEDTNVLSQIRFGGILNHSGIDDDTFVRLSSMGSKNSYVYSSTYTSGTSGGTFSLCDTLMDSETMSTFNKEIYNNVIKMKESEDITIYNSSKMVINIIDESIAIDLVDDDQYTNTISLDGIERKISKANLSGKIDLTVKYTKGGVIYGQDLTFSAFKYSNDVNSPELTREDFVSSLGQTSDPDVMVEYIDGVIRSISESEDVDECIISNCVLTYGYGSN